MYTGIVVRGDIVSAGDGRVEVKAAVLHDCEIGASVNINGVCLTVTSRTGDTCTFDMSDETLARSTLGDLDVGEPVNVERPVLAGAELGGHIVQGHVDGVGTIESMTPERDGVRMRIVAPQELVRYVVEKGSITVDGVSLTITAIDDTAFEIALVPHTLAVTTFGDAEPGDRVNLEVDVLAKYVERLLLERTP